MAHTDRTHAALAPSAAYRWMKCPGSVRLSAGIESKSSIFADEGTAAHTLAEFCLREKLEAIDYLGGHVNIRSGLVSRHEADEGGGIFSVSEEMADAVDLYLETVRGLIEPGDEVEFEAKLDLHHIPGMAFGTGDATIYKPSALRLVIVDLKYGRGKVVEVKGNSQLRTYALGVARRFHNRGVRDVECVIVQPRAVHRDGPVRREIIDALDLIEFQFDLEGAALATAEPDAPLVAGDWCDFCPAAATCPALRQKAIAIAQMEFASEPPPVVDMTPEDKARVLAEAGVIRNWVKRVEEAAHQDALDGHPPPGWKLVAGRTTRKWKDESEVQPLLEALVGDQAFADPKLRSPAQIEKVLGSKRKHEIADLISAKPSGAILAPADDPRAPWRFDAAEEFA